MLKAIKHRGNMKGFQCRQQQIRQHLLMMVDVEQTDSEAASTLIVTRWSYCMDWQSTTLASLLTLMPLETANTAPGGSEASRHHSHVAPGRHSVAVPNHIPAGRGRTTTQQQS